MKIAVFISHPIQYYSPLWQELAGCSGIDLIVHYFSKAGVEATLDPGFGQPVKWDIDLTSNYRFDFLPRRWPTKNNLDNSWKGLNRGIESSLDSDVDVAYVSGYAHLNNWGVARMCRSRGIPLMMFSDSNGQYLAESRGPKAWLKEIVVRSFFRSVSVFLSPGDFNKEYLMHYGAPEERIQWCSYPIDTARFQSRVESGYDKAAQRGRFGIPPDAFVVAFSGKMVRHKRPQDLVEAVRILDRKNVVALMIGSGELEESLGGDSFIRRLGFVNQHEMPAILSMADALVLPSSREPYGLVVTEAQCLGIPVILSDRCGCYGPHGVFHDDESGYLYPCGDVSALARCIARMTDDPAKTQRMGERARVLAEEQSVVNTARNFISAAQFAVAHPRFGQNQMRRRAQ
jgi:glycosyltransferase involved in cell wall biosynthesis